MGNDASWNPQAAATFQLSPIARTVQGVNQAQLPDTVGYLRFPTTRFKATGAGDVTLKVERYGGSKGTLSGDIVVTGANRSSGKFTPTTIPVAFADGEFGEKSYTFNVPTAPTDGPFWINLTLNTGPYVVRHVMDTYSEITVDDGVSVPSVDTAGIYEVSPTGNDANSGLLGSPWQTIQKAARTLVAGEIAYVRGGTYTELTYEGAGSVYGVNPKNVASRDNQIMLLAYPGETVIMDQEPGLDITTQNPVNNAFRFREARTTPTGPISGWRVRGFTLKNCYGAVEFEGLGNNANSHRYHEDMIFEDMTILDTGGPAGTNPGGFFLSDTRRLIIRNTTIDGVYEGLSLHLDAHDNNACIHGYGYGDTVVEDCDLRNASHLLYLKAPPQAYQNLSDPIIRRNKMGNCYMSVRFADHYHGRQGDGDRRHRNPDVYHNIFEKRALDGYVNRTFYSSFGLWFYQNTCLEGIGAIDGFLNTQIYNNLVLTSDAAVTTPGAYAGNIFSVSGYSVWTSPEANASAGTYDPDNDATWPTPGDPDSTKVLQHGSIEYMDYNAYHPNAKWVMAYNYGSDPDHLIALDLATWRLATHAQIRTVSGMEANGVLFNPTLDGSNRPTVAVPTGRFSQPIGVPNSISVGRVS